MNTKIRQVCGIDILHLYLDKNETISGATMITKMKNSKCAALAIYTEAQHVCTIHRKVFEESFSLD